MDGFSFCGVHCSAFGIGFVPSAARRTQSTPTFKPIEETVTGRAGGYFYGNEVEIRQFVLECYFEEIDTDTYERMIQWLHRDREGKLVFDDRPFVYYMARPSKVVEGKSYSSTRPCAGEHSHETVYSGTVTITFSAHDPFGKMIYNSYADFDADGAINRCGILEEGQMPSGILPTAGDYLVYNPGTELSNTMIRIAGSAPNGLKIINRTTNEMCEILTLPDSVDLIIDSEDCSVRRADNPNDTAFEYHDLGYIHLAPCTPYVRDVSVSYFQGSNSVDFTLLTLTEDNVGQYIRLNGEWVRILSVSGRNAIINKNMEATGAEYTMLATMNEISIEGEDFALTKLEMDYIPCVR